MARSPSRLLCGTSRRLARGPAGSPTWPEPAVSGRSSSRGLASQRSLVAGAGEDHLDVRDPGRPVDEVERALADHLISDVDVATSRIACLRLHTLGPMSSAAAMGRSPSACRPLRPAATGRNLVQGLGGRLSWL